MNGHRGSHGSLSSQTHMTSSPFSAKFDDGTETERTRRVIGID